MLITFTLTIEVDDDMDYDTVSAIANRFLAEAETTAKVLRRPLKSSSWELE